MVVSGEGTQSAGLSPEKRKTAAADDDVRRTIVAVVAVLTCDRNVNEESSRMSRPSVDYGARVNEWPRVNEWAKCG